MNTRASIFFVSYSVKRHKKVRGKNKKFSLKSEWLGPTELLFCQCWHYKSPSLGVYKIQLDLNKVH